MLKVRQMWALFHVEIICSDGAPFCAHLAGIHNDVELPDYSCRTRIFLSGAKGMKTYSQNCRVGKNGSHYWPHTYRIEVCVDSTSDHSLP